MCLTPVLRSPSRRRRARRLVLERAPDPERDDDGSHIVRNGEGAAARERCDEGRAARILVAHDATGLAHGVEVRKELWIYLLAWIHANFLVGRRQSRALAKESRDPTSRRMISSTHDSENHRRSSAVIHRSNVSASSQQCDDTITCGPSPCSGAGCEELLSTRNICRRTLPELRLPLEAGRTQNGRIQENNLTHKREPPT